MNRIVFFVLVIVFLPSCEKGIDFKPRSAEPVIAVEATIENGQPPIVFLSQSLNYFSKISPDILANSFIRNAEISISNGSTTHKLKEYSLPTGNGYMVYYYSNDSSNLATAFAGEFGKKYSLEIKTGNKLYTATTTIPLLTKKIDSVWWEKAPDNPDTNKVVLMSKTTDPPGFGNYIRYFTKTNREPFYPGIASVYDDQIVDGKTYSIQIERGINRNEDLDLENYSFFNRGDTVTVKLCNIDKAVFDFWRTVEYSYSSIGNPFSSPTKVISNINGGGLGYFGGYAVQYSSIIIPK